MGTQRRRRKVAKGIYADQFGFAAKVQAGGQQRERRFPANTETKTMQLWRAETRVALLQASARGGRGSFAADAERYLATVTYLATYGDRKRDINLWVAEFGERRRDSITTTEIDTVLSRWLAEDVAASTVNHRRGALLHLWSTLDGEDAKNPVRKAMRPSEPKPEARGLSYTLIEKILDAMPDMGVAPKGQHRPPESLTKVRLRVMAYTGLPQVAIMRLQPRDIDLEAGTLILRPRRKGKGTTTRMVPLTPQGADALRQFVALGAWGAFSTSAMRYCFLRACKVVGVSGIRPYDLRHSFGTAIYAATGDLHAASKFLAHSSTKTTERYTLAAEAGRLRLAAEAVGQRLPAIRVAAKRGSGSGRGQKRKKTA